MLKPQIHSSLRGVARARREPLTSDHPPDESGRFGTSRKPFVFLDLASIRRPAGANPHGFLLAPALRHRHRDGDAGRRHPLRRNDRKGGTIPTGGVEWMRAGGGVCTPGNPCPEGRESSSFGVALPPELENARMPAPMSCRRTFPWKVRRRSSSESTDKRRARSRRLR